MENTQNLKMLRAATADSVISSPESAADELKLLVIRLFDQFHGRVLNYVLTFGVPPHDAEDVVQETFLALFRHLQLGRSRSNLDGWIFRVAHNLALKRRARNRASAGSLIDDEILSRQPHPAPNAEQELDFRETQRKLRSVVEALPERDRECLYLRAEGLKYRQIAEVLGISLGAVSLSLTRSLARITRASGDKW